MVGCGGGLWARAPVGDQSEDVVDGYLAVTGHVAEAGDWAWGVVAGCAFTEPLAIESKAVILLSDHACAIGAAGSWYQTYCGDSVAPFVGIGTRYLIGRIAAHGCIG